MLLFCVRIFEHLYTFPNTVSYRPDAALTCHHLSHSPVTVTFIVAACVAAASPALSLMWLPPDITAALADTVAVADTATAAARTAML